MQLWHVSEQAGIARFEPRLPPSPDTGITDAVVWAIAESHLVNYLLPRDCPRVALRACSASTRADIDQWLGGRSDRVVLLIESPWAQAAASTPLWLYAFAPDPFELTDANAGYFVARQTVVPQAVRPIASPIDELNARGVQLRVVPQLRLIAEQVARTSLSYSIIRLRNAL